MRKKHKRQSRKLTHALLTGDTDVFAKSDTELLDGEEETLKEALRTGVIDDNLKRRTLHAIRDPYDTIGEEGIYENILRGDAYQKQILKLVLGQEDNRGALNIEDVQSFLMQYSMPMDFDDTSRNFLSQIKDSVEPRAYQSYVEGMGNLKRNMYGKRQEYYERLRALEKEADISELGEAEALKMFRQAQIQGDPWEQDGKQFQLGLDQLEYAGLMPKYNVQIDSADIGLSPIFSVPGHAAAIAYVKTQNEVKVRGYYCSNSTGLWRYLPDYVTNGNGGVSWFGKGYGEESLTLPVELQRALSRISDDQDGVPKDTANVNPFFFLAGTAAKYRSKQEYATAKNNGQLRGDLYDEVSRNPALVLGDASGGLQPPETLNIDGNLAPDFHHRNGSWRQTTALYGKVHSESFASKDRSMNWVFCRNSENRAWIADVELNAPVTSTGLRSQWVNAGPYVTPLYEYDSQSNGYGNLAQRSGNYVSMWDNYLSKMTVIKEYLASDSQ